MNSYYIYLTTAIKLLQTYAHNKPMVVNHPDVIETYKWPISPNSQVIVVTWVNS